jgi:hypothetical protein
MGDITYTFRRYTRMSKCLIPINENYFLILTLYDFDKILRKKIILLFNEKKRTSLSTRKMNKENLDYIKHKFHTKNSEFYSWEYEILRDNDKSIILKLDINVLQKDIEQLITELYEQHLYISLLLIGSDEIGNEYLVIGITEAEIDRQYSNYTFRLKRN